MKWRECSHEEKINVLHQLVHQTRIADADLSLIMAVLGYDISELEIFNANGRPGAVVIYGSKTDADLFARLEKAQDVATIEVLRHLAPQDLLFELLRRINAKLLAECHPLRRCDYPDEFFADLEMIHQWCRENCPPELQDKFPHRPWPEWLPSHLQQAPNAGMVGLAEPVVRVATTLFSQPERKP